MAKQTVEVSMGITTTSYKQYSAPATDVNGTTWKDLLDKASISKATKIWGFRVTVAGSWSGNVCLRITDGSGNKIFPYEDEYIEGEEFTNGEQIGFISPVEVEVSDGFKVQFRSTNAGDGAGETLELNNLDVIEVG